ncbi:MAG TPA: hypothetical protein VNA25_12060 [Phycisphaerae bacterium]|nr:hypothetical protein [Phycisphaerae bacterium]
MTAGRRTTILCVAVCAILARSWTTANAQDANGSAGLSEPVERWLTRALAEADKLPIADQKSRAYATASLVYAECGDSAAARRTWEAALRLAPAKGFASYAVREEVVRAQLAAGDANAAKATADGSDSAGSSTARECKISAYCGIAELHSRRNDQAAARSATDKAMQLADRGVQEAKKSEHGYMMKGAVAKYGNIARCQVLAGDLQKAEATLAKMGEAAQAKWPVVLAQAAAMQAEWGRKDAAAKTVSLARERATGLSTAAQQAVGWSAVLQAEQARGDVSGAKSALKAATEAARKAQPSPEVAFVFKSVAECCLHMGDKEGVRASIQDLTALAEKLPSGKAWILQWLVRLYGDLGDVAAAAKAADQVNSSYLKPLVLGDLAVCYAAAGDLQRAKTAFSGMSNKDAEALGWEKVAKRMGEQGKTEELDGVFADINDARMRCAFSLGAAEGLAQRRRAANTSTDR